MTKRRDLVRILEQAGFVNKSGAKHDKFVHADGRATEVPRHREIKDFMARIILREAGIEKRR